jgi:hypothetical protein
MQPTPYEAVNALLDDLLARIQAVLGEKLVGLYLYGSLVWGDYDPDTSDVDLLAALASDLSEAEAAALKQMHEAIVVQSPQWDNRIEVAYLSLHGLQTFRTEDSAMGITSPGEPFHVITAGHLWLINWYFVRERGKTLFGPLPQTMIAPISKDEFIESIKTHLALWPEWLGYIYTRGSQAYVILTMCRSLYTMHHGEQVSKIKAAAWAAETWAAETFPQWADLINGAVVWRKTWHQQTDHESTLPQTRAFVEFTVERVLGNPKKTV